MPREALLTRTLVELADSLVADFDVVDFLTFLADRCVELLDVSAAGIVLVDPTGSLRVMAASSDETDLLELLEMQNDEGPCLDCHRSRRPVTNQDLDAEATTTRWPRFTAVASGLGYHNAHALPMRLRDVQLGSLSLFGDDVAPMPGADLLVGQALADVASISIVQFRAASETGVLADRLELALRNRVTIGQAKGIIAERSRLTMTEAFALLRRHSRDHDRALSAVAGDVVNARMPVQDLHRPRVNADGE